MTRYTVTDSPVGPLVLVGDGDALTGLYAEGHQRAPRLPPEARRDAVPFREATRQLAAYFARELTQFDLNVQLQGTPFQRAVWSALLEIPYGSTATYAELAARLGRPTAARAVGLANGRNPVSIVVPCHRVIGSSGALTGYAWGLDVKRHLLEHEAAGAGNAVDRSSRRAVR